MGSNLSKLLSRERQIEKEKQGLSVASFFNSSKKYISPLVFNPHKRYKLTSLSSGSAIGVKLLLFSACEVFAKKLKSWLRIGAIPVPVARNILGFSVFFNVKTPAGP